jgi:LDH2 family malate/lactate/ureidoglycolate dehydrogenase
VAGGRNVAATGADAPPVHPQVECRTMNQPPPDAIRVPHEQLQAFVSAAARAADVPEDQATLLSGLLIASDLRGVLSHGSRQIVRYVRELRSGRLNPRPRVSVVRETPTSVLMDGDWGLGYFPAREGTLRTIEKAERQGMAAMVTRHHGHIGAAGIYTRMTIEHDMLAFATSGVQIGLRPGETVLRTAGGSPMSFTAPAMHEPPLVLDCGVSHDLHGPGGGIREDLARLAPGLVLRAIGFGTVCQAWGGLLAGLPIDSARAKRPYAAANQGAMLFAFKISLFADVEQFKREVDEYAQRARRLTPVDGTSGAYLPGGLEADHEHRYRREGIPLGESHRQDLERLGDELGLRVPWR